MTHCVAGAGAADRDPTTPDEIGKGSRWPQLLIELNWWQKAPTNAWRKWFSRLLGLLRELNPFSTSAGTDASDDKHSHT